MILEKEKMAHINFLMDDIHDSVNCIYEALADRLMKEADMEISLLIKKLRSISESIKDKV